MFLGRNGHGYALLDALRDRCHTTPLPSPHLLCCMILDLNKYVYSFFTVWYREIERNWGWVCL